MAYGHAPYFDKVMPLMENILKYSDINLSRFIRHSFEVINHYLGITTKLHMSSEVRKNDNLRCSDKIIDMCKTIGADFYINPIGGNILYDKHNFFQNGIYLLFHKGVVVPYEQGNDTFEPSMSMIDILMHNSVEDIRKMINIFETE